jgi:hypothetical protein
MGRAEGEAALPTLLADYDRLAQENQELRQAMKRHEETR